MKSKTSSVRLPKEMFDDIDSICDGIGCTRNDWIKEAIDEKLEGEKSQDQEVIEDTKPDNSSSNTSEGQNTPRVKATITKVREVFGSKESPEPKITVESIPEPKITVESIPEPTVESIPEKPNPPATMININGVWYPYAKRFDI